MLQTPVRCLQLWSQSQHQAALLSAAFCSATAGCTLRVSLEKLCCSAADSGSLQAVLPHYADVVQQHLQARVLFLLCCWAAAMFRRLPPACTMIPAHCAGAEV